MHDTLLVGMCQGVAQLDGDIHDLIHIAGWNLEDSVPLDVFHNDVGHPLCFTRIINRDDIGVIQLRRKTSLSQDAGSAFCTQIGIAHHLDRYRAVEQVVMAEVDNTYPASPSSLSIW